MRDTVPRFWVDFFPQAYLPTYLPTYPPTDLLNGLQAWARLCGGGGVLPVVDQ